MPLVSGNNLVCSGYVGTASVDTSYEIVGAQNEKDQFNFAQNDYIYVSVGANRGAKVGDMYSVIRPRGKVETRWSKKRNLGVYVQEVGAVELVDIKNEVSVARVKTSCDNLLLGDLLQPIRVALTGSTVSEPVNELLAVEGRSSSLARLTAATRGPP